jgi:hypothetical protein
VRGGGVPMNPPPQRNVLPQRRGRSGSVRGRPAVLAGRRRVGRTRPACVCPPCASLRGGCRSIGCRCARSRTLRPGIPSSFRSR